MKNCICIILTMVCFGVSCTKDILPNPADLNASQTIIYDENFDLVSPPALPGGWSATSSGWVTDSSASNISTGYTGASGLNNLEIANPTSGSGGTYTVTTKAISTTGFTNISVIYGARNSKHFSDNGSKIASFEWSSDGGTTWNNIPFSENPNDSNWYLVNGGVRMALPVGAIGANIKFRWTASIVVTPSGTYRIDDFQVYGTAG